MVRIDFDQRECLDNWKTKADMTASVTRTPIVWICSGINGLKGNAV